VAESTSSGSLKKNFLTAMLETVRRQLDESARASAELQAKLQGIVALL
jgi:hypothetical protein